MNSHGSSKGSSCFLLWRYSLYADNVLFFFSKTSARARELAVNKSSPVYISYHARPTDFEEKIESL